LAEPTCHTVHCHIDFFPFLTKISWQQHHYFPFKYIKWAQWDLQNSQSPGYLYVCVSRSDRLSSVKEFYSDFDVYVLLLWIKLHNLGHTSLTIPKHYITIY
jgi:hypothetical protein